MSSITPVSIRLESCGKTFADGTRALRPLDLEIFAGETLVFLGPSGCGKTTTLRIIAGLESPDPGGRVWFDNQDVTALPIEKRNVGMVFQSYALFPNMTVEENVGYGLRVRGMPKPEIAARAREMLDMMRITQLGARQIDQLSGGQRQRVALARALAARPRVLLLDEPLTALDAKLRDTLRLEISELLRRLGITAIYVTHDQAEAMALGDRIVVMAEGIVAQVGPPRDIYQRPANRFVAEFIGTMNVIKGQLANGHFTATSGAFPWPDAKAGATEALVRPEDIEIAASTSAAHLQGNIEAAFYMGDHTRVFVDIGDERPVVVETTQRREFKFGEPVGLRINSGNVHAL